MKAPLTVNGYMIQFDRRRYGSTTYTWAYAVVDDQWVSLGDPYPAIRFPIRELERLATPERIRQRQENAR